MKSKFLFVPVLAASAIFGFNLLAADDPLPSWNDAAPKKAIIAFVAKVTTDGSPNFVPVPERIAVFDNDGTLWAEKPVPFQILFVFDRVKALAPRHPEWQTNQPFASLLGGDMAGLAATGEKGIVTMLEATSSGITTEEFSRAVSDWIAVAKHPQTGKLYTEMVYQPMLELLAYLRANGFETWIVSASGIDFMRPWTERVYGIPPEQVVGSSPRLRFEIRNGRPELMKLPEVELLDDRDEKPVGIQDHIGRRPIAAFGNSDGDQQMFEWTMGGGGARFALLVHHDDAIREYAYDRKDKLAKLDKAWDEAKAKGWTVVSMKNDWKTIFREVKPR